MAKADNKRMKFARAIVSGKTQKEAAILAGYSKKSAEQQAVALMKHPEVKRFVETANNKANNSAIIDRTRIIQEWNKIGFRNAKTIFNKNDEMLPIHEISDEDAACISEVMELQTEIGHSRKIKFHSKEAALKELAKLGGLYPEEGTGESRPIVYVFGSESD